MKMSAKKSRKKASKKAKNQSSQRGPRYWIAMSAMGALVAYSAVGSQTVRPAYAREGRGRPASHYSPEQPQSAVRRFDIKPGPLAEALMAFEKTTGLQVIVSNDAIRDINSPGLSGTLTD